MFIDFMGVCFDQIFNQAAKFRYMFGGKAVTPVVIRTMWGAGLRAAAQHSQSLLPVFTHIPGLKVVAPSNPYDAKGLLIQSIRDDDPVIFAEHKMLYDMAGEVPEESYAIPFGEANIVREGGDVTIVAIGRMVNTALEAAERAGRRPASRPRSSTRAPPARWTSTRSWSRWRTPGGWSWSTSPTRAARWRTDIAASSRRRRSGRCGRRSSMVTGPHTPVPFADSLEDLFIPDAAQDRRRRSRRPSTGRVDSWRDDRIQTGHDAQVGPVDEDRQDRRVVRVAEGDTIAKGDDVVDIETDKIAGTLESPVAGPVRRIVAAVGAELPIGAVLAVVAPTEVPDAEIDAVVEEARAAVESGTLECRTSRSRSSSRSAGGTISYLTLAPEDPSGEPVVLVHGFGGDKNSWLFVQQPLAEDAHRARAGPAGARRVGQGRRRRVAGDADRHGRRVPRRRRASSGRTWWGTRWAGRSSRRWPRRRRGRWRR